MVAEVGATNEENRLYKVMYDGTLYDEQHYSAIGGQAEQLTALLGERFAPDADLPQAIAWAAEAFDAATERKLGATDWEAAVVDRTLGRRTFRRLSTDELPG
jgi:proteasome alpha subunit